MTKRLAWAGVMMLGMVAGACNRQDEPPVPFNAVLTHGGVDLPPVPLARPEMEGLPPVSSARLMKKISGATGAAVEAGAEAGAARTAEPPAAVTLNDADPQALMEQYVELSKAGNLEAVATMYVDDQQPFFRKVAASSKAVEAAARRLHAALESGDAELAKQFAPNEAGVLVLKKPDGTDWPPIALHAAWELAGVETPADDQAAATLKHGETEKKLELRKVADKWRIRDPEVPAAAEEAARALASGDAFAKALSEVADKVEKNELQAADVLKEIPEAVQRAAQAPPPAEPAEAGQSPPAEGGEKPAEDAGGGEKPAEGLGNDARPSGDAGNAASDAANTGPRRTRSNRDANNEAPTLEESLGRQ